MPADRLIRLSLAALLAAACSDSSGTSPGAGQDGGPDAPADAASDAPADAANDEPTTSDADGAACSLTKPYSSSDADCNACAEASCCAEVNACYADPDCDDGYVNCILACALLPGDAGDAGTEACLQDCGTQFPVGEQEYDAAIGCVESACALACE